MVEDLFLPRADRDVEPLTVDPPTPTTAPIEGSTARSKTPSPTTAATPAAAHSAPPALPETGSDAPRRRAGVWLVLGLLLALLVGIGLGGGLWLSGRGAQPSPPVVTQIPAAPSPLPVTVEPVPIEASTAPVPGPLPS